MAPTLPSIRSPLGCPPPVRLDSTFGAVLIGTSLGLTLYGMVVHQCYRYFGTYRNDSSWIKVLVSAILVFETFHVVSSMHICYHYLVTKYSNGEALLSGVWSIDLLSAISGIIIISAQSFFAARVFLLGGRRYRVLVTIAMILLAGELGFFFAATVKAFTFPSFSDFQRYTWLVSAGAALACAADALLTGVLVNLLRSKHTGVERLDQIMDRLIKYTINTGLLTSVVNLLSLVFSVLLPSKLIYVAFGIVATKLYANSLLAALNARSSLQYVPGTKSSSETGLSTTLATRREATIFELQGQSNTSTETVAIIEGNQAALAYELVGIAL
ncbi:hypothetical protein DICSQDRAFT_138746 [Dichomitus squalens LYAD-421 SS1]|uniref:DUF6534 domain-containing protein n=1 Tax=Dichomitus squalens (strain LYAD-421) TaxID=732165 RepID=R7SSM6_DICSQ|nr:uncharacterized protein DICSQDRAFT_138746 [Dichomitus squalens LYAD-421 SS1]EJF59164.1 hypothetical protein DICSQDRAFT_138746 [Dichomitus squalens LYAD-421 SS1]